MTDSAESEGVFQHPGPTSAVDNESADADAMERSVVDFSFRVPAIAVVLVTGLILRLILATLPGFSSDISVFQFWSNQLAEHNPWNFYDSDFFIDYAPGYLYVLWWIGKLHQIFHFSNSDFEYILKIPPILADLASAYLLYRMLDSQKLGLRVGSAALYLLFPATLLVGSVWGQTDSLLAFLLLLSVYFISRDRPVAGAVTFIAAFMVKPQAMAALPFLALWIMRRHPPRWIEVSSRLKLPVPPGVWLRTIGAAVAVALVLLVPFFTYTPWDLYDKLRFSVDVYPYSTVNAYNFWAIIDPSFRPDDVDYRGISYQTWGLILFAVSIAAILLAMRKSEGTGLLALGTALSVLVFYVFLTRMHERYLFPFFLPFLVACVLARSRFLWTAFIALGAIHFLNLYYPYSYYALVFPPAGEAPAAPFSQFVYDLVEEANLVASGFSTIEILSIATVAAVPILVAAAYKLSSRKPTGEAT